MLHPVLEDGIVPREAPLVSQYIERIGRDAVEKYPQLFMQYVRHRQGVYALYRRKKLYYVGLAGDLRWRLRQHLRDHHGGSWDRFSVYFTIGETHLRELETLILHITGKPRGNQNQGKFRGSENLKRALKNDIKRYQREELLALIGQEVRVEKRRGPRSEDAGRRPALASCIKGPMKLRASLKRRKFKARVRRDGSIIFRGKTFNSPSAAGSAACKRASNGWYFWKYERAPGDWARLRELRK
jgi:hypothetical protein